MYKRHQEMGDSVYMTPESSDIAMVIIKHKVLDIRRQTGKAVESRSLPQPTAFPACKENLCKMKQKFAALEALHDPENSE